MKIRNKLTGEIKEIDPAQLGSFGLSAPAPSMPPTTVLNESNPAYSSNITPKVAAGDGQNLGQKVVNTVGDIFFPTVKKVGLELDPGRRSANTMALNALNNEMDESQKTVVSLQEQAKKEKDPKKRSELLDRAKAIYTSNQTNVSDTSRRMFDESGMTKDELAGFSSDPNATAINQGMGAAGEVGSWFAPGESALNKGSGANYLQKIVAGGKMGAKVGLIKGLTTPTTTPTDAGDRFRNTVVDTSLGFAGGAATQAVMGLPGALKGAGKGIEKLGDKTIQAQYNMPRSVAKSVDLNKTVGNLADYGVFDINDVPVVASKVTGPEGAITKLQREALGKIDARIDTTDILPMAQNLADDPLIPVGQDKKFVEFIKKGIDGILGKSNDATEALKANPMDTFEFIQKLEKKAYSIGGRNIQLTAPEEALKTAYLQIAEELKNRVYGNVDDSLIQDVIANNPTLLKQLNDISPLLADRVKNAATIQDLRALAAPFVRGNIAADVTMAGSDLATQNVAGAVKGAGKLLQNPLNMVAVPLSTDTANANIGGALHKIGGAVGNMPEVTGPQFLNSQLGGRMFTSNLRTNPPQNEAGNYQESPNSNQGTNEKGGDTNHIPNDLTNTIKNQASTVTGYSLEKLGSAYAKAVASGNTAGAAKIKQLYDMEAAYQKQQNVAGKTKSSTQVKMEGMARSGISSISKIESLLKSDPGLMAKNLLPGKFFSREYDSALFNAVDAILRMRTGAQAPEKEIRRYMNSMGPTLGDSPEVAAYKINQIKQELQYILDQSANVYDPSYQAFSDPTQTAFMGQ